MNKDISSIFNMEKEQIHILVYMLIILVTIGSLFIYGISFAITKPIRALIDSVKNISKGNYTQRITLKDDSEIGELATEFNIMAETVQKNINKLENIAVTQENFVSNFTHELKTPLTAIIGYSDMLRTKILSTELVKNSSNYIYTESKRLESLTIKLLDLVSLNDSAFNFKQISSQKIIQDILNLINPILINKKITIQVSVIDTYLNVDEDLIKTLLLNLLDNSIKASSPNSTIEILGYSQNNFYLIEIKDEGIGIPENELEKITQPFYMVDKSRSRKENGIGLGLSLCQKIANIHNAKIAFKSKIGIGTTVTVKFNINNKNRS